MVFQTKKIQLETLGEYLTGVRSDKDLSVDEVANQVGMKQSYLQALEDGDYHKLPPDVYVLGFLKQLGQFYSIDAKALIEQYRKERGIAEHLSKKSPDMKAAGKQLLGKIVITPKVLTFSFGMLFVLVTVGYVIWQVLSINKNPTLEILEPKDRQVIRQSSVEVSGKTDPGMTVTINDQNVFVNSDGTFRTEIGLTGGPKELVFVARNKFDKTVTKTISILGEQQAPVRQPVPEITLKLEFTDAVTLETIVDDSGTTTKETFVAGQSKTVSAVRKILVSTSNAGATHATFNGQDLGVLGRVNEKLKNVPFSVESGSINNN